jgi:ribonuclease P protein component
MTGEPRGRKVVTLTKRAEFLAASKGRRHYGASLGLQAIQRQGADGEARFGLTVSRKVGTAVERNRVKRRLRAALRAGALAQGLAGHDYVIVGRRELLTTRFDTILSEIAEAITRVHRPRKGAGGGGRPSDAPRAS